MERVTENRRVRCNVVEAPKGKTQPKGILMQVSEAVVSDLYNKRIRRDNRESLL